MCHLIVAYSELLAQEVFAGESRNYLSSFDECCEKHQ